MDPIFKKKKIYSLFMNKINLIRKQESWRPFKVSWEGLEEVGETRQWNPNRNWVLGLGFGFDLRPKPKT